ncbi:MAG TPA: hypothetical protein ENJ83_05555, partial [Rhodospirillales bacterium]|nr:hypothetical protein [Rhodospirillales bacterium]
TCCALQPLRNLPFRHIQILGLDEAAFPRPDRRSALDALTVHSRRGDRSPRDDDRLMLLETLLAARDALHLHFQHRDPRDDSERQPAAPLIELLEYLQQDEVETEQSPFVKVHPLQPFSPRRYRGDLPACDPFWHAAASALTQAGERLLAVPLGDTSAPLAEGLEATLALDELARFLSGPLEWFFTRGLGVPREQELPRLDEEERFALNGLDGYRVRERLWQAFEEEAGVPERSIAARLRAEGLLPEGPAGEAAWGEHAGQWHRLRKRLVNHWGERLDPVALRLPFEYEDRDFALEGWLRNLHEKEGERRILRVRLGNQRPRDLLALWVDLLAGCALGQPIAEARTVARDGDIVLAPLPPETAREHLTRLARLALEGLTRPLPLAPEAVALWLEEPDEDKRAARILGEWEGWAEAHHFTRIWGDIASPLEIQGFTAQVRMLADLVGRVSREAA